MHKTLKKITLRSDFTRKQASDHMLTPPPLPPSFPDSMLFSFAARRSLEIVRAGQNLEEEETACSVKSSFHKGGEGRSNCDRIN